MLARPGSHASGQAHPRARAGRIPGMRWYTRAEIAIGFALLAGAGLAAASAAAPVNLGVADVYRWLGVALLGQGLLRDIAILATVRRRGAVCACRATALCLESLLGLGLIAVYLSLLGLRATGSLTLGLGPLLTVAGAWWLLGTALKDVVLEARREADHLNVVVGFR